MKFAKSLALLSFVLSSFAAGQSFEGTMTFSVTGPRGTQEMKYMTKGDNVRMDMEQSPGMKMSVLINTKSKDVTMLMHPNKMYMQMNMESMQIPPEMKDQDADFKKTGKTEKILGYVCEQVIISQADKQVEMWVTKGLGKFVQANMSPKAQSPLMKKLEKELTEQGYFPLRMISKTADGSVEMKMEVTAITKSSLKSSLFVIPAGYQKMEMPARPPQQ